MVRLYILALFSLGLLVACAGKDKGDSTRLAALAVDPSNAVYLLEGRQITLVSGRADEPAAPGSASRNVTTLTDWNASGDFDGDGKQDLAVLLTSSPGGTGTFYYVAALPSSGTSPYGTALIGDRVTISHVQIENGLITVHYLTRADNAPLAATPSVPAAKSFSFLNGQLRPK